MCIYALMLCVVFVYMFCGTLFVVEILALKLYMYIHKKDAHYLPTSDIIIIQLFAFVKLRLHDFCVAVKCNLFDGI